MKSVASVPSTYSISDQANGPPYTTAGPQVFRELAKQLLPGFVTQVASVDMPGGKLKP